VREARGSPHTAILDHIKDAIQNLPPQILAWPSGRFGFWQVLRYLRPFGIIQMGRVSFCWFGHQPNLPYFSFGPIFYAGGQLLIALSCSYFLG
jgi:hypothetical protein